MRDIFEEIFENQPLDPEESVRRSMRPNLRARFYQAATVGEGRDGTLWVGTEGGGLNAVKDRVHVHDLQATILHCLGLDHTKLTHRHMGRDFRLTDVAGRVVPEMLL